MSRPRKRDKHLPAYVRPKHGSYQYRGKVLRKLDGSPCRVSDGEAPMYESLARQKLLADLSMVPAAVAAYKLDYLPTLSQAVRKDYSRILDVFSSEFAEYRVDQVTPPTIKKSIRNLYSEHPSAGKSYKARISTFFAWAVSEEGLVKVNPCREVTVTVPPARRSPWTPALFWSVREKLSPMHQCYHDLSYLLYQRTTDVRRLKRAQLLDDGIHFEPSKTLRSSGAAVIVPYSAEIRDVLDRAAALSKDMHVVCPYVIHTSKGAPYTRSGVHSAYRRVDVELHGQDDMLHLNPKALLPFAVTQAKKQGATLEQLQVGRAHMSITTTEGYVQTHDVPVSEVVLRMPEKPKGKP